MSRKIRIFRLGNAEKGLLPTDKAVERLASILENNPTGPLYIIWGPDIDVIEIDDNGEEFKVEPVAPKKEI